MEEAFLKWGVSADWWTASTVMVVFASYVALDLARGVASRHRSTVWRSLLASALALSTGIWATHFISLAGDPLPFPMGYERWTTFGALALALAVSMLGTHLSARHGLNTARVTGAALVLGTGACAVPAVCVFALHLFPAAHWKLLPLLLGWALTCLGIGITLAFVAASRRSASQLGAWWQAGVALGLGGAFSLGNATILQSVSVPLLSLSLATDGASTGTLSALATLGVPLLLSLLLMGSLVETHFRRTLKRMGDEVKRVAQTDRLTELPNRSMFEEGLQVAAIRTDRHQGKLALLFINVDGLKAVNESFGQSMGDSVLCQVAQRLRSMAGPHDIVARAGGDEFLLLLQSNPDAEEATRAAAAILQGMNALFRIEGHEVSMSCSVGVA